MSSWWWLASWAGGQPKIDPWSNSQLSHFASCLRQAVLLLIHFSFPSVSSSSKHARRQQPMMSTVAFLPLKLVAKHLILVRPNELGNERWVSGGNKFASFRPDFFSPAKQREGRKGGILSCIRARSVELSATCWFNMMLMLQRMCFETLVWKSNFQLCQLPKLEGYYIQINDIQYEI